MQIYDVQLLNNFEMVILDSIEDSRYSLKRVCNMLFISRSQLHRRIKALTGLSTTHYIRKIRLEKSKELLNNKVLRVNEVAVIVGINNAQNFSKYFKQEYGVSPSVFKMKNNSISS